VIVNGNVAGTLPLTAPLRLNEGRVTVEVRAAAGGHFALALAPSGGVLGQG